MFTDFVSLHFSFLILSSLLMLSSLLVYFLTYLSSFRIDQFCFQARGRRRRPKLALFLVLLLCCSTFCVDAWLICCVCFRFLVLSQEIGWDERLRNDLFCIGWDVKT